MIVYLYDTHFLLFLLLLLLLVRWRKEGRKEALDALARTWWIFYLLRWTDGFVRLWARERSLLKFLIPLKPSTCRDLLPPTNACTWLTCQQPSRRTMAALWHSTRRFCSPLAILSLLLLLLLLCIVPSCVVAQRTATSLGMSTSSTQNSNNKPSSSSRSSSYAAVGEFFNQAKADIYSLTLIIGLWMTIVAWNYIITNNGTKEGESWVESLTIQYTIHHDTHTNTHTSLTLIILFLL